MDQLTAILYFAMFTSKVKTAANAITVITLIITLLEVQIRVQARTFI